MYQPQVKRCGHCESRNAKLQLRLAKQYGVDAEFPWEAFRKANLTPAETPSQVGACCAFAGS